MRNALTAYLLSSVLCMAAGVATETAPAAATANGNKVPQRLKPAQKELLLSIHKADPTTGLVVDSTNEDVKIFLKAGWLLEDRTKAQGNNVPVILSEAGKAKAESYAKTTTQNPGSRGPVAKPEDFEIENDVPMPDFSASRRIARQVYPFDKLSVGQSFFIPKPENYKGEDFTASKQGTIAAQNRKAKAEWEAQPAETRNAEPPLWKVTKDAKGGVDGARVFRVH